MAENNEVEAEVEAPRQYRSWSPRQTLAVITARMEYNHLAKLWVPVKRDQKYHQFFHDREKDHIKDKHKRLVKELKLLSHHRARAPVFPAGFAGTQLSLAAEALLQQLKDGVVPAGNDDEAAAVLDLFSLEFQLLAPAGNVVPVAEEFLFFGDLDAGNLELNDQVVEEPAPTIATCRVMASKLYVGLQEPVHVVEPPVVEKVFDAHAADCREWAKDLKVAPLGLPS